MSRILVVGNCALDVISVVDHFPAEDEEMRAVSRYAEMGGNSANTARVLAQSGHDVSFAGTFADDAEGLGLLDQLDRKNIDTEYARTVPGITPISYILVNQKNGSRTIVHYRNLPEYRAEDFDEIPLYDFDWIHFEGRNIDNLKPMLTRSDNDSGSGLSLEIEKDRRGLPELLKYADAGFISPQWIQAMRFGDQSSMLKILSEEYPGKTLTCTAGAKGAWGIDARGTVEFSPAYPPAQIVDTVAAGDVFNASMIHALLSKLPLGEALKLACQVAGRKTGLRGLEGITLN